MDEILDEPIVEVGTDTVKYGSFWPRFGAVILDGLIFVPVTFGVNYFNIITWNSPLAVVVITMITLAYKPFMEFQYGATLGKMALKLKVVNMQYEQSSLNEILLRNIFNLGFGIINLALTVLAYRDPEFMSLPGLSESNSYFGQVTAIMVVAWISGMVKLADFVVFLSNKQYQSLHDKIGRTYVIHQ